MDTKKRWTGGEEDIIARKERDVSSAWGPGLEEGVGKSLLVQRLCGLVYILVTLNPREAGLHQEELSYKGGAVGGRKKETSWKVSGSIEGVYKKTVEGNSKMGGGERKLSISVKRVMFRKKM